MAPYGYVHAQTRTKPKCRGQGYLLTKETNTNIYSTNEAADFIIYISTKSEAYQLKGHH